MSVLIGMAAVFAAATAIYIVMETIRPKSKPSYGQAKRAPRFPGNLTVSLMMRRQQEAQRQIFEAVADAEIWEAVKKVTLHPDHEAAD